MIEKKTTAKKVPARRGRPPNNANEAEKPKLTKKGKPTKRPDLIGNKFAKGCTTNGKPRKFKSVELLQEAIDAYFADSDTNDRPYTMTDLAIGLGYYSRSELVTAESFGDDYSGAIKRARFKVQGWWERRLGDGSAGGPAFWLKNNAGYIDESTINQNIDDRSEQSIDARLRDLLGPTKGAE